MNKHYLLAALLILLFCFTSNMASAQEDKSKRKSPPAETTAKVGDVDVTINYSQPSLRERELNTLAPVGKVWRTGANEAAWISVSDDVKINGKTLKKGKYGLFTINNESEWIIIFNSVWNQWGAYNYDETKDVLRIKATPKNSDTSIEKFTIDLSASGEVNLLWGKVIIPFTVSA